ncbi:MAG: radical SAM protein [Deltaproteobacteria bacterium]|nr:radical SAM protein [Deltaproteobacteria bacterium]
MFDFDDVFSLYRSCRLCPRGCGVDRLSGQKGFCGETAALRLAAIEAHFGEEPPISGSHGSGTIFFTGCSLRCSICQNWQISLEGLGRCWSLAEVVSKLQSLSREHSIHNVNFVTPDHFFPHTILVARLLRRSGFEHPFVYNLSGYQLQSSLDMLEPVVDIYLVDFKYGDVDLARHVSRCHHYPSIALEAIGQMIQQKGFLDSFDNDAGANSSAPCGNSVPLARKGVLVRHLIIPGHLQNSLEALTMLFIEFGSGLPLSLMSQYTPVRSFAPDSPFNRRLNQEEFRLVLEHAFSLGFSNLFVQYPEKAPGQPQPFLPDFTAAHPFRGNIRP